MEFERSYRRRFALNDSGRDLRRHGGILTFEHTVTFAYGDCDYYPANLDLLR